MRARFIQWDGHFLRLSHLARLYGLAPGTFYGRLQRFGETATGINRALCTGIMRRDAIGRLGASHSPWRHPG
jgi:hypothetical protein